MARWKVKIVRKETDSWRVMLLCWAEQKCIKRTKNSVLHRQCILSIKVKVKVVNFWNSINWRFDVFVRVKYHQKKGLCLQTLVIITIFWHFTSLTFTSIITKPYDPQHVGGKYRTPTSNLNVSQANVTSTFAWTFHVKLEHFPCYKSLLNSINHCRTNNYVNQSRLASLMLSFQNKN